MSFWPTLWALASTKSKIAMAVLFFGCVALAGCRISPTTALESLTLPRGCPICGAVEVDDCFCYPDPVSAGYRETRWRRLPELHTGSGFLLPPGLEPGFVEEAVVGPAETIITPQPRSGEPPQLDVDELPPALPPQL